MRTRRTLLVAATAAALSLAALSAPTAAANPRVAFVNGIPGTKVDVCIGSSEVRSNLRYGGWFQRSIVPGNKTIRFRRAAAGTCSGQVVAQKSLILAADADITVVGTAHAPDKVLVFDNVDLGVLGPALGGSYYALRHGADLGEVTFYIDSPEPISPAADPVWVKGDHYESAAPGVLLVVVAVSRPDSRTPLASTATRFGDDVEFTRIEWILVGTNAGNARIVTIVRGVLDI